MISRRDFLRGVTGAGAAGALGLRSGPVSAEAPPETRKIRLAEGGSICLAPQFLAEDFLRGEGFTDVQYVKVDALSLHKVVGAGEVDLSMGMIAPLLVQVDTGDPVVLLAGIHVGCFEVFVTDQVRTIRDLRGKEVAIPGLGSSPHVFLASILAHVGLDPRKDVNWVTHTRTQAKLLLAAEMIDAYLGFPPDPQELRAKKVGRVLVNSSVDRPWSQYFCCMLAANREFARRYPIATRRAMRAVLKATNVCALEPERAARSFADRGYATPHDYGLQAMKEIPYNKWREYNPEDTVRFYALRLHEAGLVKSSPQKILAQGTDWRLFNELKRELKG